jgi:hypothetical protein
MYLSKEGRSHFESSHECFFSVFIHCWRTHLKKNASRHSYRRSFHATKGATMAMCDNRSNSILSTRSCAELSGTRVQLDAERELAAFYGAVSRIYGAQEAQRAALGWIEAWEKIERTASGALPDSRQATITASAQLASRIVTQLS